MNWIQKLNEIKYRETKLKKKSTSKGIKPNINSDKKNDTRNQYKYKLIGHI